MSSPRELPFLDRARPVIFQQPRQRAIGEHLAQTVKSGTVILHSRADDVVPFADSEELIRNSGLAASALIEVGIDHRLADPQPLAAMLKACVSSEPRTG